MTSSTQRDQMLGRIRAGLGVTGDDAGREAAVRQRVSTHPRNLIPGRTQRPHAELLDLFTQMLQGNGADVTRLASLQDIPQTVADYLRDKNLPAQVRLGADSVLTQLPWQSVPALALRHGPASGDDTAGLTRASAAAAETGTLFFVSGAANPTTINFLPDTHIAVIRADDIVGPYEDAWDRLRAIYGAGVLPRTVNLISAASRTADIEQTIVMGVHGPRRLHVILVEDAAKAPQSSD